jgi:ceramide glucosyltransferase
VTALALHLARPCFGATIAMRRETLSRIGGFAAFADCLADDYMLGQAVRSTGLRVAIPSFSVGHVCCEKNFNALRAGQLRTARAVRSINPLGHIGSILAHPFPLAIMGALLGSAGELSWWPWCHSLCARLPRDARSLRRALIQARPAALLADPLVELILFAAYLLSLVGRTVTGAGPLSRRVQWMPGEA